MYIRNNQLSIGDEDSDWNYLYNIVFIGRTVIIMKSLHELDQLGSVLDADKMKAISGGSFSSYLRKHVMPWFRETDRIGNVIEHISSAWH